MALHELTTTMEATQSGGLNDAARTDLVRLFGLDRLSTRPRPLVCHWQRGADGRLFCIWTRDTKPALTP